MILIVTIIAGTAANIIVINSSKGYIVEAEKLEADDADYVIVLGAGYINDYTPSNILADRITQGAEVYEQLYPVKLMMSGDSENREEHDEANVMKNYALSLGVDSEDIVEDPYGINTYDSIWRAKYVYGAQKIVICTQKFHLYRAVYIARKLGMEAYGVDCLEREYHGAKLLYELRELIARTKEFIWCIFQPEAKYAGN